MHVGIVGAGQLGRMLALAGYPIGVRCLFLDRSADTPGAQVAPSLIGDLEDAALLAELASRSDVVTFDWENISGSALKPLEKITQVRPPRAALEVSQDRLAEKALFTRLKIPVAAHCAIDSREELIRATQKIGLPGVLKTRRLGYDGKGQYVLRTARRCRSGLGRHRRRGPDLRKISRISPASCRSWARAPRADRWCSIRCPAIRMAAGSYGTASHPLCNARLERSARAVHETRHECPRLHRRADDRVFRGARISDRQ